MKDTFALLPFVIILVMAIAVTLMIIRSSIGTYQRVRTAILTYLVRAAVAVAMWIVVTLFMVLVILNYLGVDFAPGYEPPIMLQALKFFCVVAIYIAVGSLLVWWMKQEEFDSLSHQ